MDQICVYVMCVLIKLNAGNFWAPKFLSFHNGRQFLVGFVFLTGEGLI